MEPIVSCLMLLKNLKGEVTYLFTIPEDSQNCHLWVVQVTLLVQITLFDGNTYLVTPSDTY